MAGPGLQLFPPPPRPRQASPNSKQLRAKPPSPDPGHVERMDSAADFHELVVEVNSAPVSPENDSIPPPPPPPPPAPRHAVTAPPRAHLPVLTLQTPPQHQRPGPPPRPKETLPNQQRSPPRRSPDERARSPPVPAQNGYYRSQTSSPELNRTASPAFSTAETLVRANSTAQRNMTPQPEAPMRSIFPVFDPTKSLSQQAYKPTQASPTHIPRTQISRSPYSPDLYVPHNNIASSGPASPPPKPFFTPSHLLDNLWVAANGQEEPAVQLYTLRMHRATAANPTITFGTTPSLPFYSLAQSNLAGDHSVQSIMNELLIQRHHPTQPRVLPIAQLDLMTPPTAHPSLNTAQNEPVSLLTSIFPKLAALQALDAAANSPAASHIAVMDPGATSPAAQRLAEDVLAGAASRECCALTYTRDPPQPRTNPWANQMAPEGTYQLHHPTLGTFPIQLEGDCSALNRPSTRPITAIYGHNMSPTPQAIPQKPASITILNPYILSPSSPAANSFSPLRPPPRIDSLQNRPISITPSEMSLAQLPTTTDAAPDDAMLARLDFANDALTLNLGALTRFGNPFLVDVACATLLSVAVAESQRGRRSRQNSTEGFAAPPVHSGDVAMNGNGGANANANANGSDISDARAFREAFRDGFNSVGGKVRVPRAPAETFKKWSNRSRARSVSSERADGSFDKDIELGEWYGQSQSQGLGTKNARVSVKEKKAKKGKKEKQEEEDKLPFVARTIITVLTFAFKAAVFVMKVGFKIVAGVVVMITRNFGRL